MKPTLGRYLPEVMWGPPPARAVRMGSRSVFALAVVALIAARPTVAPAQVIELLLREDSTRAPVGGAIVRLVGPAGVASMGLTDERGRIALRAPTPGAYRIRIDRIGWTGLLTEPLDVKEGETIRKEIPMKSSRVFLPTVTVRGATRCGRNLRDPGLTAVVWEEIEKALTATLISRATPIHLREFVRELGPDGKPEREWVVLSRIVRTSPFRALPARHLVETGFVTEYGDSLTFLAPDAETILSEEFVGTHCFRAIPGPEGIVGLGFEPVRGRRVPEITGTLWVNRATGELRDLEYSYTGVAGLGSASLGGRIDFRRLPGGRWIVSYWHIRMPRIETAAHSAASGFPERTELRGYYEKGGRAEPATDTLGFLNRAILSGTVFDSTLGRGLAGAIVGVRGTPDSILVGADGRFELAVAAAGDQVVTARHPKLGLLGDPVAAPVLLSIGDTATVSFGVPSLATFTRRLCRNRPGPAIIGMVLTAQGVPAADREVRAVRRTVRGDIPLGAGAAPSLPPMQRRALDDPIGPGHSGVQIRGVAGGRPPVLSSPTGVYAICAVPARDSLFAVSADSGKVRGEAPAFVAATGSWVDIREWGSLDTTIVRPQIPRPPRR